MLGRLKALTQHDEIPFAHRGLSAKADASARISPRITTSA
jgi:hypothetical protein